MLRRGVPAGEVSRSFLQGAAPRLILCALAALVPLIFGAALAEASTAVGAIAGSFSATPTGGAVYSIPLPAPGGAGGLAPSLSIDYASGSGPGLLGWDVTMGGLSAIKRCASSWPYDGTEAPVNLTSRDRFCLDGQELSTDGSYGGDGTTYETTPSAHLEAISHTSNTSLGPDYFVVLHPDGSRWEYGHTSDAYVTANNASGTAVPRAWLLDKITDASGSTITSGNTITFHYTQPSGTGAYYLNAVDWGGNTGAGTTADHSYAFGYTTVGADATVYRYLAGNEITWNRRISSIKLEYNGATTLSWTLNYLADGEDSDRSRLKRLTECAGSDCLPSTTLAPTTLTWQQGTPGYGAASNTGQSYTTSGYAFTEDVNGDGREDLVYDHGGSWWVRLGQVGGGFGAAWATGVAVVNGGWAQPIHYKPGPGDQILVDGGAGTWKILAWNGNGFSPPTDTGIAVAGPADALDVNGDGYDDIVTYSGAQLSVRLNTASSANTLGFGAAQTAYTDNNSETFVGFRDVGAGAARGPRREPHFVHGSAGVIARVYHNELMCINDGCTIKTWLRYYEDHVFVWQNGALVQYAGFAHSKTNEAGGDVVALDVNGDGLSDLVPAGAATLLLNTGSGFTSVTYGSSTSGLELDRTVAVDYSGNGREDLLVPSTTSGDWMLLKSTGAGFAAPADTGIAAGAFGATPLVADTEGRGLDDLVGVNGSGEIELALRSGPYPDQITHITDGLDNTDALTWVPRSNADIVKATGSSSARYELSRRGPYVLTTDLKNDGIGGSYTLSRTYDTPVTQGGVGPAGFERVSTTDDRNGYVTTTVYAINSFYRGLVESQTTAQGNGDLIRKDVYEYQMKGFLQKNMPKLIRNLTTTHYGAMQNELYTVSRDYTYDTYYVPDDIKTTTTDYVTGKAWIEDTARTNDENNGTDDWCMNLASTVTVTDTLPTGASASRETDYGTDLVHCRIASVTTDAGAALRFQTTRTLGYDGFGNIATDKVVGHNPDGSAMAPRTTTYS